MRRVVSNCSSFVRNECDEACEGVVWAPRVGLGQAADLSSVGYVRGCPIAFVRNDTQEKNEVHVAHHRPLHHMRGTYSNRTIAMVPHPLDFNLPVISSPVPLVRTGGGAPLAAIVSCPRTPDPRWRALLAGVFTARVSSPGKAVLATRPPSGDGLPGRAEEAGLHIWHVVGMPQTRRRMKAMNKVVNSVRSVVVYLSKFVSSKRCLALMPSIWWYLLAILPTASSNSRGARRIRLVGPVRREG